MKYSIEFLKWDSDFFLKRIGKITIENEDQLDNVDLSSYDLVYVFSKSPILKYPLVDKKITYSLNLNDFETDTSFEIDFYNDKIDTYENLLSVVLQSGEYSRFYTDRNFTNNEYERLYKEWIDSTITKRETSHIIVKRHEKKIIGLVTLIKKSDIQADISLLAVDKNYRGRGIARELILKTINLSIIQGYNQLQVVTQLDNIPANILYKKCGFTKKSLIYIYHIWNYDPI